MQLTVERLSNWLEIIRNERWKYIVVNEYWIPVN